MKTRKNLLAALSAVVLLAVVASAALAAQVVLTNGGFEEGDDSGWTEVIPSGGYIHVIPSYTADWGNGPIYYPPQGDWFALLKTDGPNSYTTLSQTFTAAAGDTISGWAFFDATEISFYNDQAEVRILSDGLVVAQVFYADAYQVGFDGETDWTAWQHNFESAGTYTLEARVTNASDSSFDAFLGIDLVQGQPQQPLTADAGGPYLVQVEGAIQLDGTATGPCGDPLSFLWTAQAGSFNDETLEDPIYTAPNEAGIDELAFTANCGDLSGTAVTTVVVYAPGGGFVTGGGWIDSQPGAYALDPALAGKANFGFVSKYSKGQQTPDGQTEFQFQVADLNFHSEALEWLVVNQNGTNAQFKGSGTINGEPAQTGELFKFMIWATDGDADSFRIKIWYEDSGDEITIYDNGSSQAIGGGSIVVHASHG